MTKDEVLNMPAGYKMDALIAEKVMKQKVILDGWGAPMKEGDNWISDPGGDYTGEPTISGGPHPYYSTDIAAAWEVVEKFYSMSLDKYSDGKEWRCYLVTTKDDKNVDANSVANTAPLAICRAALLAIMETNE